ncbi:hypothetical protein [Rivularia sp. UHCC 0363]|uniref:hypothetical protein n=1 Tax=Rivularia sp. UHCC 0363 TaxID=3110244 RepID=UPI002B1EEBB4|nr:hypothetical protein [Rivularia sp. UHCC 0363]MEA5596899.1 hypothetical protein [Rivularia sp. UHCC 0363]
MDLNNISQQSKKVAEDLMDNVKNKGKEVVDNISEVTKNKAEEITEEAIITAVDKAINIIEIASQRVKEKQLTAENVSLEVNLKIVGIAELKMRANVPTSSEGKREIIDVKIS